MPCWATMDGSGIAYRTSTASIAVIHDHLRRCDACFDPPLHTDVVMEEYARKIHARAVTAEAWDGNTLVGVLAVYLNRLETRTGYITNVSVLPNYQRQGIASELMRQVIELAREKGFIALELEVLPDNTRALGLYRKFGFATIGNKGRKTIMRSSL